MPHFVDAGPGTGETISQCKLADRREQLTGPVRNDPFEIAKSVFEALEANKDQRIEPSEMPEEMKADLGRADLDRDGSLSLTEITNVLKNATATEEVESRLLHPIGSGER